MVYDFPSMMRLVSAGLKNGFVWQKSHLSFIPDRTEEFQLFVPRPQSGASAPAEQFQGFRFPHFSFLQR